MSDSRGPGVRSRVSVVAPMMSKLAVALQKTVSSREEEAPPVVMVPDTPITPAAGFGDKYLPVVPSGHVNSAPEGGKDNMFCSSKTFECDKYGFDMSLQLMNFMQNSFSDVSRSASYQI